MNRGRPRVSAVNYIVRFPMTELNSKAPPVARRDRWGTLKTLSPSKAGPPSKVKILKEWRPAKAIRDSIFGRPSLCTVNHARYFYSVLGHVVNDKKGKRRHWQFPRAFHASEPAAMGKRAQQTNVLVNCLGNALRGGGRSLYECIQRCGTGLAPRQLTSESAFTNGTSGRGVRQFLRG